MATNRFMQPIQGPRNQEFFKLDYDQLATGVLAREDAYEQNAAEIDALDQDYIKGIEGMESDRAKEINANIEGMVSTIGDKYNGDLSKSGDAIRNAKKYIKKTTGFDSEGSLINNNLKEYNANVKELQALKGWSQDEAKAFIAQTHAEHNVNTASNKETAGEFATYQRFMPNEWQDIHEQSLKLAKEMPIDKLTQMMGLNVGSGRVSATGEPEFLNTTTGKWETKSSEEIASKLLPVIMKDPKNAAYLDSAASSRQWRMDQTNPNRIEETQNDLAVASLEYEVLKDAVINGGEDEKKALQEFLGVTADGDIGPNTQQAIINMDAQMEQEYSKDTEFQNIRTQLAKNAVDPAADFFEVADAAVTTSSRSNSIFVNEAKAKADELLSAQAVSGIGGVLPIAVDIGNAYKNQVKLDKAIKAMSPSVGKLLNDSKLGFGIDSNDPEAVKMAIEMYDAMPLEDVWFKLGLEGDYDIDVLKANPEYQDLNYSLADYQNTLTAKSDIDWYFTKNKGNLDESTIDAVFNAPVVQFGGNKDLKGSGAKKAPANVSALRNAIETAVYSGVDVVDFISTLPRATEEERYAANWAHDRFTTLSSKFDKANPNFEYKDVLQELPVAWFVGNKGIGDGAQLQSILGDILKTTRSSPMGAESQSLEAYEKSINFTRGEGETFGITYSDNGKATFVTKGFIDDEPHSYAFTNGETNEFLMKHIPNTIAGQSDEQTKNTMGGVYFGLMPNNFNTKKVTNQLAQDGSSTFNYSSIPHTIIQQDNGRFLLKINGQIQRPDATNQSFPDLISIKNAIGRVSAEYAQ